MLVNAINPNDFNILEAQIGFKPEEPKKAFLTAQNPVEAPSAFELVNSDTQAVVYSGAVEYWGQTWGFCFWVMDFSDYKTEGSYFIQVPELDRQSTVFQIQERIFTQQTLIESSVGQLEQRIGDKMGWQDCGTDLRAVEGHATQLFGLQDAYLAFRSDLSPQDDARFVAQMRHGSDYLLACQKENGSFGSEYYVNPNLTIWNQAMLATTALTRTYSILGDDSYLAGAMKGWGWCTSRPYYSPDERNAEIADTRRILGQYSPWLPPEELRLRDKLLVVWAATELYQATNESGYKQTAMEYAAQACSLQNLDYTQSVRGLVGNFFAWPDSGILQKSWEHGGWNYSCGTVLPDHLLGIINLVKLFPDEADALQWRYTLRVYTEYYLKQVTQMSPFQVYPLTGMYPEEIRFFGPSWHGGNGIYGNIAKNAMILGRMYEDVSLEQVANANLQWVGGLNFGIDGEGRRQSSSFLDSIGVNSASTWSGIRGSIANGLASTPQFTIEHPNTLFDSPLYYTHEDWIVHNGGWLSGLSETEKPLTLQISTTENGVGVPAQITISLPETHSYTADSQGQLLITGLPVRRQGTLQATYNGHTIQRPLATLSGDTKQLMIEFAESLAIDITLDADTLAGTVTATNSGFAAAATEIQLSCVGAQLSADVFSEEIAGGTTERFDFTITVDPTAPIRPVYIFATAQSALSSASTEFLVKLPAQSKHVHLPNHSFASGDLTGWNVVSGNAFANETITDLNTAVGGTGEFFNKQGEHLLWGYIDGDDATGEMHSQVFTVAAGESRLKIAGGNNIDSLYVALVDAQTQEVYLQSTGNGKEQMVWIVWDTTAYAGKQCYVKAYDNATGGWSHLNLDAVCVSVYNTGYDTNFLRPAGSGSGAGWQQTDGGLIATGSQGAYMTADSHSNFVLESDITLQTAQTAGLILRSGDDPFADGGYYAYLDIANQQVALAATNPWTVLGTAPRSVAADATYHLRAVTKNQRLSVYVDGETTPNLEVEDTRYTQGKAGVAMQGASAAATARFNHSTVRPSSGFETNLTGFIPEGNNQSWTEQPDGLVGDATDGAFVTTRVYGDFTLQADMRINTSLAAALVIRSEQNPYTDNGYFVNIDRGEKRVKLFSVAPYVLLGAADREILQGVFYHLRVVAAGTRIEVYFDAETEPCIVLEDAALTRGVAGTSVFMGGGTGLATFNNLFISEQGGSRNTGYHRQ